jgi:uncharacterized protein (TIGR00251 family)
VTRLAIRVQPSARRAGLVGRLADGTLKVAVTAPPEDGRANAAVGELMAELLGLKARQVRVVKGMSSRSKTIEIDGLDEVEAQARLAAALAAAARGKASDGQ